MLVMFDCDGVLVDSEGISRRVLCEMVSEFGLALDPHETERRFAGRRLADCLAEVDTELRQQTGATLPEDAMEQLRAAEYVALAREVTAIRGIERFLDGIQIELGALTCVASNGPREKIECTLGATGLRERFGDRIFSAYDSGIFKPDPHLYRTAASALGYDAKNCIVVEDSVPGVQAGIASGARVLAYTPGLDKSNYPKHVRLEFVDDMRVGLAVVKRLLGVA